MPKLDLDSFSDDMVSAKDTYESASTLMSFPLLALFTHRSVHGTNACFRPDVNHHQVFMQNLYKPQGVDGRPGMADTIFNPSSTRTLNATPMGVWFYSVRRCATCTSATHINFSCDKGSPLKCFHDVHHATHRSTPLYLKNAHADDVSADDFHRLLDYFWIEHEFPCDKPTVKQLALFLARLKSVFLKNVQDIRDFCYARCIPIEIDENGTFPNMMHKLVLHYQAHCPVRLAAWEGGHRQLAAALYIENLGDSPYIPFKLPKAGKKLRPIPDDSTMWCEIRTEVTVRKSDSTFPDFFRSLTLLGKEFTKSTGDSIQPGWQTTFRECIAAFQQAVRSDDGVVKRALLNDDSTYLEKDVSKKTKDEHHILWEELTPKYLEIFYKSHVLHATFIKFNEMSLSADQRKDPIAQYSAVLLKEFFHYKEPAKSSGDFRRRGVPQQCLFPFHLLLCGLLNDRSLKTFQAYFGEPTYKDFSNTKVDIHSIEWIKTNIIVPSNTATEYMITKILAIHLGWQAKFGKAMTKTKARFLIRFWIINDMMDAITKYGPNPKMTDRNHIVSKAVR